MVLKRILQTILGAALGALWSGAGLAASGDYTITGPHVHDNLAVYLVHGASAPGPVPLTLQEAIAKGAVRVDETGNVNQLDIENTGIEEVFVQAGDIVKGGKQDRVLTVSLLLQPSSGKIPIGAFCVEQGRWAARGKENVRQFASAATLLPSREAKIAILAPAKPASPPVVNPNSSIDGTQLRDILEQRTAGVSDTSQRQREVWDKVKKTQDKLAGNVGGSVAAPQSASSLQLSLENERVTVARQAYVTALKAAGEKDADVIGFVVAVNGKLSSADVYPSNGLFRKMWEKQLAANAVEAVGDKTQSAPQPASPAIGAVQTFLSEAEKGTASSKTLVQRFKLETRDGAKSLFIEATRADGALVHRNYLAK